MPVTVTPPPPSADLAPPGHPTSNNQAIPLRLALGDACLFAHARDREQRLPNAIRWSWNRPWKPGFSHSRHHPHASSSHRPSSPSPVSPPSAPLVAGYDGTRQRPSRRRRLPVDHSSWPPSAHRRRPRQRRPARGLGIPHTFRACPPWDGRLTFPPESLSPSRPATWAAGPEFEMPRCLPLG